jgi:hypothetical protein
MSDLRLLCLFSSPRLAGSSWVGQQAGHWASDLDQGRCEFVPLALDGEAAALAVSGLFSAAVVVCDPADLGPALAAALGELAAAFASARLRHELVPCGSPVSVLGWLAREVPALVPVCRADGEVRLGSPSWWRDRARRHLAAPAAAAPAEPPAGGEDLAAELSAFVARRGW